MVIPAYLILVSLVKYHNIKLICKCDMKTQIKKRKKAIMASVIACSMKSDPSFLFFIFLVTHCVLSILVSLGSRMCA